MTIKTLCIVLGTPVKTAMTETQKHNCCMGMNRLHIVDLHCALDTTERTTKQALLNSKCERCTCTLSRLGLAGGALWLT